MDHSIVQHMKRSYSLMIGDRTAEEIKIKIGSAYPLGENELTMEVKGRDQLGGLPKTISITSTEIREALTEPVASIVEAVRATLDNCPPELSADLIDHGIALAGGGALLRGLDKLISEETGLPVAIAEEPLIAVAKGTGMALQDMDLLARTSNSSAKRSGRFR